VIADLVFRGALVVDGSGPRAVSRRRRDRGGRIVAVAPRSAGSTRTRRSTPPGLALMPGIIDSHTHFDAQITWDPTLSPSPALGVTTAVIGNCGFTIAPCRPAIARSR
jgi:N-acyl-D-aspartate/D-glutamate deacylase